MKYSSHGNLTVDTWRQVTKFNTGPFTAPCGLIRLDFRDQSAVGDVGTFNIVTVELVPGNHRGYLCESMEEF